MLAPDLVEHDDRARAEAAPHLRVRGVERQGPEVRAGRGVIGDHLARGVGDHHAGAVDAEAGGERLRLLHALPAGRLPGGLPFGGEDLALGGGALLGARGEHAPRVQAHRPVPGRGGRGLPEHLAVLVRGRGQLPVLTGADGEDLRAALLQGLRVRRGGGRRDPALGVGRREDAADGEARRRIDLQPALVGVEAQRHLGEHARRRDGVEQPGRGPVPGGQLGPDRVGAAGLLRIGHRPQRLIGGAEVHAAEAAHAVLAGTDHEHVPGEGQRRAGHLDGRGAAAPFAHPRELVGHLHQACPVGREREDVLGGGLDLLDAGLGGDELGGAVGAAHEHGSLLVRSGVDGLSLAQRGERRDRGALEAVRAGGEHGRDGQRGRDDEREARSEQQDPHPAAQPAPEQGEQERARAGAGEQPGREAQRPEQEMRPQQRADPGEREQHHGESQRRRGIGAGRGRRRGRRRPLAHRASP